METKKVLLIAGSVIIGIIFLFLLMDWYRAEQPLPEEYDEPRIVRQPDYLSKQDAEDFVVEFLDESYDFPGAYNILESEMTESEWIVKFSYNLEGMEEGALYAHINAESGKVLYFETEEGDMIEAHLIG